MKLSGIILRLIILITFSAVTPLCVYGRLESSGDYIMPAMGTTSAKEYTEIATNTNRYVLSDLDNVIVNNKPVMKDSPSDLTFLNDEYAERQWALNNMNIPDLWRLSDSVHEVIVAVLDTGIDQNHEDLKGKVIASVNFTDSNTVFDINGHGTHVAGIIAAYANNKTGIAGAAPDCFLLNVKVADDQGFVFIQSVADGIFWAVDNGADVINISLALHQSSLELCQAIDYAWQKGVLVVAAAGNTEQGTVIYPAYYNNTVAVTAVGESDTLAPLSNFAEWVDVAAPGVNIYSCLPENCYGYKSGTSFATGYVSGIAALLYTIVTDINNNGHLNDEVRAAIEKICQLPVKY